jgi:hypothetical protein
MVSNNDDFVRKGPIDDTDDIPKWCGNVFLLIDKIEDEVVRRWTDVVFDTLVFQTKILLPPLIEIFWCWTDSIECLEKGKSINVGDWDRRNRWDGTFYWLARRARLGRIPRSSSE